MNFVLYVSNDSDFLLAQQFASSMEELIQGGHSFKVINLMGSNAEGIPAEVLKVMMLKKTGTFPLLVADQMPVISGVMPTRDEVRDCVNNGVSAPAVLVNRADSAVDFPGAARIHISVDVVSLEKSLPFYKHLFGVNPVKLKSDYAKFELTEPSLNITLNQFREPTKGGPINHFGIQVKSSDAVMASKQRLETAGFALEEEVAAACCYAVQTKIWATDPDGIKWEVYVVTEAEADEGCGPDCICFVELEPSLAT